VPTRALTIVTTTLLLLAGLTGLNLATAPSASAAAQIIPVPTSAAGLGRIVASPDGSVWFTERDANKVGKISPSGQVTEFPFSAQFPGTTRLMDLDVAPDGSVWVVYESGEKIAHLAASGAVIATGTLGNYPYGEQVRVGPDGVVWVTMSYDESYVVRIVGNQIYAPANAPECTDALGEAADGSMWCRTSSGLTHLNADANGGTTYPANNYAAYPYAIAAGPVGSVWFGRYFSGTFATSPGDGEVGYLDAATGAITAFNTGSRTAPNDLVPGPDGNMWFTSIGAAKGIGHISPNGTSGALTAIGGYAPRSLTFGTDGFIYATDSANNVIIKVSRDELQTTNVDPGEGSVLLGASKAANLGKAKLGKKPLAVRNNAVNLRLACPKDASAACVGKARLTTNAKKKPKAVSRSVRYEVEAGKKGQLKLKLTAKGLKALKKGKVTKLRLELYAADAKEPAVVQVVKVRR
jgi:virginiamycin B lyase